MTPLVILAAIIGLPGLAAAAQLTLLGVASLFYRERSEAGVPLGFLVLIPAHNEERVIARCLQAVMSDRRSSDQILVVADRCSDDTARIARAAGAKVLERGQDEPPGRAATRQAGLDYARSLAWDAVVMLDADSVIEPGFFGACERALSDGVPAVQARSESSRGRSLTMEASLAAFALQGITLPRGRGCLGLSVRLRGTGMAIRRDLALSHRFRAPASEDLFFTLDLLLEGTRCRHVDAARLRSEGANTWQSFGGQKVRYEAGRMSAARAYIPRLVRRAIGQRDLSCLDAAWLLATPPFALATLSLFLGMALSVASGSGTAAVAFGAGLVAQGLTLVLGLIQARARLRTWLALAAAPWYVAFKTAVQARALLTLLRRNRVYGPTARA